MLNLTYGLILNLSKPEALIREPIGSPDSEAAIEIKSLHNSLITGYI